MDTNEVTSKAQLVAALKASAHDSFAEAKQNPFEIALGRTKYTFKEGLHTQRLDAILSTIGALPVSAFAQDSHGDT